MADEKSAVGVVLAAGAAGGMAEVVWIAAVAPLLGVDGGTILRAVSATVVPSLAASSLAPGIGLLIHFSLSIALAAGFVRALGHQVRATTIFLAALGVLAAVWAFNFLLLLPRIDPAFVSLLPHPVTLISKLLFAIAMASVLARRVSMQTFSEHQHA